MNYKIVADSSADLLTLDTIPFSSVPLHILVGEQEFVDDENVDIAAMQEALTSFKGKTSTACPSPAAWHESFGDADVVFCVTITSGLSGACSSALIAKDMYETEHPGRKVYVYDTLSTGPEMALLIEKIAACLEEEMKPEEIDSAARAYMEHTHLFFALASLHNFARNGRISPIVAKGVGMLGIRIVGKASDEGTLQPIDKCRGEKKAIPCLIKHMKACGYTNGRIIISHYNNPAGAEKLKQKIIDTFGSFNGYIHSCRALCCYYAEPEAILIGFEA